MLTASTAARAPKRLGFSMPAPPETIRTSAAQCRGGFRKKSFRTPLPPRSKRGYGRAFESKNLFPKIASPVAPCRFGPSQESDTGALSIATTQIDATAACMHIGHDACDAHGGRARGRAHEEPASVEAPVAGVGKVSHPENSGFPLRMWLRSWLRLAKVARRGWSMRSILDNRETAAGVWRLPRTLCESVGER